MFSPGCQRGCLVGALLCRHAGFDAFHLLALGARAGCRLDGQAGLAIGARPRCRFELLLCLGACLSGDARTQLLLAARLGCVQPRLLGTKPLFALGRRLGFGLNTRLRQSTLPRLILQPDIGQTPRVCVCFGVCFSCLF